MRGFERNICRGYQIHENIEIKNKKNNTICVRIYCLDLQCMHKLFIKVFLVIAAM